MEKLHLESLVMKDLLLELDDFLIELKTHEGSEEIDRLLEEYMEMQAKIEELISDSQYIEWLDYFTKEHISIDDESWISRHRSLDDNNRNQVENLYFFYIGIRQYAKFNNIKSSSLRSYYIKFNDFYFNIGRSHGEFAMETYVSRHKPYKPGLFEDNDLSEKYKQQFIDFNEIINNFGQYKSDQVSKQLCILSSLAKAIHKNGVSIETIVGTVDTEFSKIKRQKEMEKETQESIKTLKLKK